jgi:hypothetical protein
MYGRKMHFVTKCLAPKALFIVTLHPEMEKTERQKRAMAFASEYLELLMGHEADQEKLVRRMVDERIAELQPMIEELVEKRIAQKLKQNENRK